MPATYFIRYSKTTTGYKAEGFSRTFKTATELKNYFNRTSASKVKFIKV
jgi:hypothetical protein